MDVENEIINLNKNVPDTLSKDLLDLIESKEVLNKTFESSSYKTEICYTTVEGIMANNGF